MQVEPPDDEPSAAAQSSPQAAKPYPPLERSRFGGTPAALQNAVVWTMFHYGIAGWAVYALLGMAMGYFAYRWDMPLSIRAALYPLLGKRVRGPLGDGISIIALVGTVFGVATSMGIGVVLLSVGFSLIFGLEQGLALQIALVIGAVILTIAATTSGVDRGIRWISELNLWSAVAMMVYILITGQTAFLLNALVENIGQFIVTFPARTLQTFAYAPGSAEWMGGWRDGNGVRDAYLRVTGDHHRLFGDGILLQGAANGAGSARGAGAA